MGPTILDNSLVGVQPMPGPTAQIFAIRPRYDNAQGEEIYQNPRRHAHTGVDSAGNKGNTNAVASDTERDPFASAFSAGSAMSTLLGEGDVDAESSVTIDSVPIQAKTRAHKASFSEELAQDMQSQHNVDARALISGVLGEALVAETKLEILRKMYLSAVTGAQDTTTAGVYDLDVEPDGRWLAEKGKILAMRILKEASEIHDETRLGHGNFAIVDSNTFNLLWGSGMISDLGPSNNLLSGSSPVVKDTNPGIGNLMGQMTVYRDDVHKPANTRGFCMVGWKGSNPWEAGMYHAPYIPAWLTTATDERSFQPRLAWKSRYGLAANPLADTNGQITAGTNPFYRKFRIDNLVV